MLMPMPWLGASKTTMAKIAMAKIAIWCSSQQALEYYCI
jgi:hypothetical protein